MGFHITDILTEINYPITEYFFKEKLGTGDQLNSLIEKKILLEYEGNYIVNKSWKCEMDLPKEQKRKIHIELIEKYNNGMILTDINDDFRVYSENYFYSFNLSYHYMCIGLFDDALKTIFSIAKKGIYWGFGDAIIEEIDKFVDFDEVSKEVKLRGQYYFFLNEVVNEIEFTDINRFSKFINNIESLKNSFTDELYIECKNLEGILTLNSSGKVEESNRIYKNLINYSEKHCNYIDKEIYGIVLENYVLTSKNDVINDLKKLDKAEEIFHGNNNYYELARLLYIKLLKLNRAEAHRIDYLRYLEQLKNILEDRFYPDIERNLFNFMSNMFSDDGDSTLAYIEFKIQALTRDFVLGYQFFVQDIVDVIEFFDDNYYKMSSIIIDSSSILIDFLTENDYIDEMYLIKGILEYLEGNEYNEFFEKIEMNEMREFAYSYVREY